MASIQNRAAGLPVMLGSKTEASSAGDPGLARTALLVTAGNPKYEGDPCALEQTGLDPRYPDRKRLGRA